MTEPFLFATSTPTTVRLRVLRITSLGTLLIDTRLSRFQPSGPRIQLRGVFKPNAY